MAAKKIRSDQRRFRVDVTAEDIAKAKRNDSQRCVVAQAIARTIPDATRIEVDTQTVRFTRAETGERLNYLTPPEVYGYVIAFDAGDELGPFRFWIDRPLRVSRRLKTEAGRKADTARAKAKRDAVARKTVRATTTEDDAVARTVERATTPNVEKLSDQEKAALGKQAYENVKAQVEGEALSTVESHPLPRPRVYKTGKRVYGSRILRVNRYLRETEQA